MKIRGYKRGKGNYAKNTTWSNNNYRFFPKITSIFGAYKSKGLKRYTDKYSMSGSAR